MPFRIEYEFNKSHFEQFQDTVISGHLEKISVKELISMLIKYLQRTNIEIRITTKLPENVLGRHWIKDHYDLIELNGKNDKLTLSDLPSVVIHECLHGLFPQVEDDDIIVNLDRKVLSRATKAQINQIMNLFFKNHPLEYHGTISRKVGTTKRERGE